MQALEKAQQVQKDETENGTICTIDHISDRPKWVVVGTERGVAIREFKYADPKPLVKDTYCMCGDGIMRHAMGELDGNGVNKFYAQGFCSKNVGRDYHHYTFKDFEIIETPGEFERVQTPDEICRVYQCQHIREKHSRNPSIYGMHKPCLDCTILTVTPSKLKSETR